MNRSRALPVQGWNMQVVGYGLLGTHQMMDQSKNSMRTAHHLFKILQHSLWSKHVSEFTYNISDIEKILNELCIPWEISKNQPFDHSTVYIGFIWNLHDHIVSLSHSKADKYLKAIRDWERCATHTLQDVRQLYDKRLHIALLIPWGRVYLIGLEHMLAVCSTKLFLHHYPDIHLSPIIPTKLHALRTGHLQPPAAKVHWAGSQRRS